MGRRLITLGRAAGQNKKPKPKKHQNQTKNQKLTNKQKIPNNQKPKHTAQLQLQSNKPDQNLPSVHSPTEIISAFNT